MLHVGARIPGPARRVRKSVGEPRCNITHICHLLSRTFRAPEPSFAEPPSPPYTWQPSPRLPAGPVLRRGVAQPGRAPVSKTGGWGFESLRPCKEHDEQTDEAGAAPSGHPGRSCPGRCGHASGAAPAEEAAHGRPPVPEGGPSGAEESDLAHSSGTHDVHDRRARHGCRHDVVRVRSRRTLLEAGPERLHELEARTPGTNPRSTPRTKLSPSRPRTRIA